jgi:transposase-like protein
MFIWPITDLLDEQACYADRVDGLHPDGLHCPRGHRLPSDQAPHDRHRAPIYDYRCRPCGAVFQLFTGPLFAKTHYSCRLLVLIRRGIAQGVPTKHLANELHVDRGPLLARRHAIQALLQQRFPPSGLDDDVTEGDDGYSNAREKGRRHADPADPPTAGQQAPGAWHLGHGSPTRSGDDRAPERADPGAGAGAS